MLKIVAVPRPGLAVQEWYDYYLSMQSTHSLDGPIKLLSEEFRNLLPIPGTDQHISFDTVTDPVRPTPPQQWT